MNTFIGILIFISTECFAIGVQPYKKNQNYLEFFLEFCKEQSYHNLKFGE